MKKAILALALVLVFLSACASLEEEVTTPPETNVVYTSTDGTELSGYLAVPDGDGPFPAVMMIHEWWGLNQDVVIMAKALSELGYVVLAPDALRGELATNVPGAIALNTRTPDEQIHADLDGALSFLRDHDSVDPSRIATMGFCFGGRHSMRLGIRTTGLAAVITLYGSNLVTDPAELGNMAENGPVLGIFGKEDGSIPLREVEAFGDALEEIGAEHTITIYPEVGHAFVKSSTYQNDGAAGDAWDQLVAFLGETIN
jgi:carboxymethylenebutenolidase